jgi:hypothetical protein
VKASLKHDGRVNSTSPECAGCLRRLNSLAKLSQFGELLRQIFGFENATVFIRGTAGRGDGQHATFVLHCSGSSVRSGLAKIARREFAV